MHRYIAVRFMHISTNASRVIIRSNIEIRNRPTTRLIYPRDDAFKTSRLLTILTLAHREHRRYGRTSVQGGTEIACVAKCSHETREISLAALITISSAIVSGSVLGLSFADDND